MKHNHIMRRLAACVLTLAMLLPCVLSVPAAEVQNGPIEMYRFTPGGMSADISAIQTNHFPSSSSADCRYSDTMTKYTPDGPVKVPTTGFYNRVNSSGTYGLPFSDSYSMGKRVTENLKLEFVKMPTLLTKGKEVVNIQFEYAYIPSTGVRNVAYDELLRVYVSLDGATYLDDYVGIRWSEMTAAGVDSKGNDVLFYTIQTENLLDIEGVEPGDRIRKIMIMPDGDNSRVQVGHVIITELMVHGYEDKEAFEAAYPYQETVTIDPDILRQIVVEEAARTANIAWTTDKTIYAYSPSGSSVVSTSGSVYVYPTQYAYQGPVYERVSCSFRERYQASVVDGKHTAGYINDLALGMDCQTFAFNAMSRVSRTNGNGVSYYAGASGMRMIDGLKSNGRVFWTELDVIPYNTPQELFACYAKQKPGDVLFEYTSAGGVHVRLVAKVVPVYNADGTIDPDASKMYCTEQTSTFSWEVKMPDGTQKRFSRSELGDPEAFLKKNPGCEIMYGHNAYTDKEYTFTSLRDGKYAPYTLDVYDDGVVELEDNSIVITSAKGGSIVTGGVVAGIACNYPLGSYDVKLEDLATGTVLFEDGDYSHHIRNIGMVYKSDKLDAVLAGLTNGEYRLSVSVDSGPFTKLGQSKLPTTTETMDFTVTGKAPAADVSLEVPASAAKGEEVTVRVQADTDFDVADVEVKFDTDILTYVGGTIVPECAIKNISRDAGVVRVACVDAGASAGTLAELTFKANEAVSDVKQAVQLKSAVISSAQAANNANAAKALETTEACASVNMSDVSANAWYHDAVDYALNNGIMGGYNATTFGPNDQLSRAMVVQVLYNKEGQPTISGEQTFPDVKSGDWFSNAVTWGAQKGVVGGYGDGRFGPNDNVTIEQIAVILWNYSGNPEGGDDLTGVGAHSDWAENALRWAQDQKILNGVPYDMVTATATRAQTAQMLMNFLAK